MLLLYIKNLIKMIYILNGVMLLNQDKIKWKKKQLLLLWHLLLILNNNLQNN